MTFYAVCNANGPISVRLNATNLSESLVAFDSLDKLDAIDSAKTDAENDLGICGADMNENDFSSAMVQAGAKEIYDLSPIVNPYSMTSSHLQDGWTLWVSK